VAQGLAKVAAKCVVDPARIVQTDLQGQSVQSETQLRERPSASETARIVRAAARGDHRAWDQLVERYTNLLWAIARAHRLSPSDAADVVQTSWLRLVEHLPRLTSPGGVGAWLATTARRESMAAVRRAARCQPSDQVETLAGPDAGEIDAELLTAERDARLWRAFNRLPTRDQALLRLLVADPAPSYEEIGAAVGMRVGSIGPTRARALERLRLEMSKSELATR
jgi:RNA polymerase sigma factor (sigma-70 family)